MKNQNSMNRSSIRGISLSAVIIFSMILILIPNNSYADEIDAKGIGLDETVIITLENNSKENIKTVRMWLGENLNFKSFKTEKGWVGDKTPQGVIIFTSSETIKIGESVKFGIKTDKPNPIINWKGVDKINSVIDTGVITTTEIEGVNQNPQINSNNSIRDTDGEIFSDSTFKIIPDKLNPGSTIRIVGEKFGALQVFDFYINAKKIGSFDTDNQGNFITTMKIPENEIQDRVDFKIKNNQDEEKVLSLRIGNNENRYNESTNSKITLEGIANIIHRGDQLQITGTGSPSTSLILEIKDCVNFLYLFKLSIIF